MSCAGVATGCAGNCGCGASGSNDGGCGLAAPVRPRFFCGQLLADTDLTALTDWVAAHRRLDRFRTGHGVLCGLWLRADPDRPAGILVDPGVAVSGCGDDIVVPATARLDLSTVCGPAGTSCAELSGPGRAGTCVVDIGLRFQEQGADPVLSLGGSCAQSGPCEDSRIDESYALVPTKAVPGSVPDTTGYAGWEKGYRDAVGVVAWAVQDGLPGEATAAALAAWLQARIAERPLTRFQFLSGAVADFAAMGRAGVPERFAWLLFWLALDRLLAFLAGECPAPPAGDPVRLGRVWLRVSGQSWAVVAVDTVPPLRAPLAAGAWPAPLGRLNLARAIWQDQDAACLALRDLGVPLVDGAAWTPASVAEVWRLLQDPPVVACGTTVSPRWLTVPDEAYVGGTRVVGLAVPAGDTVSTVDSSGDAPSTADSGPAPSTVDAPARAARKAPARKAPRKAVPARTTPTRLAATRAVPAKKAAPVVKAPAVKAAAIKAAPAVKATAGKGATSRAAGPAAARGTRSRG